MSNIIAQMQTNKQTKPKQKQNHGSFRETLEGQNVLPPLTSVAGVWWKEGGGQEGVNRK